MIKGKSSELKDLDQGSEERLLAEEEGVPWTKDGGFSPCGSFAVVFTRFLAICVLFMSAPVLKETGVEFITQGFNGSLLKENIFRQDASPEVDAAWESLGVNYRAIRVAAEDAQESGIAVDQVKINPKYGGGFPANVEGMHHLHCLDLLRQSLYYNYDYYHSKGEGAFSNSDYIVRHHVSHCLDILRQQLMCTVDTGIFGQVWIHPENPEPYVDFNTQHRCKNFEKVRHWAEMNQLPTDLPNDFLIPPTQHDTIYDEMP
ncbi:hypothetical protein N7493_000628 [Penicillium malachiteum]|uniref:Tat pathway signal sequence n=1 Tax=Penicillium malachiteum TaxID=1324776 RepID=A0AAD6N110_9EURO|nr:hypothetical protein N7493_000628 [Penicillium malachiteum]